LTGGVEFPEKPTIRRFINPTVSAAISLVRTVVIGFSILLIAAHPATAAGSITVLWDANTEPDLAGYMVSYGNQPGTYTTNVNVGNQTSFPFPVPDNGLAYYFAVRAYNTTNQFSPYSVEVAIRPPVLVGPPNQGGHVGAAVSLQLQATDQDGDAITYGATGLPVGLMVNPTSGAISGILPNALGNYNVTASASDGLTTVFRTFTWTVAESLPGPPEDVQVVVFDRNGDSYKDILRYNRITGSWTIRNGNASGQFDPGQTGGWAPGWQILVADFNGDGLDDLFLYSPASGTWYKVVNTGSGFTYFGQGWLPGFSVYIVDLNADGRSDVFLHNPATGLWYACTSVGNGTTGFSYTSGGWAAGWQVFPADFDGDGRSDLLLYNPISGTFFKAITRGGPGVFTYYMGGWAPGWLPFTVELNGDGRDDVFLYNATSGVWYRATSLGDGTGPFSYVSGGWAPGWTVQVADFDANGISDLFLYGASGAWYKVLNNGSTFSYFGGGWALWQTAVSELNGDGKSDVFLYDRWSRLWYRAITTTPGAFTYTTGTFPP
jgi:hypothetical protein